MKAPEVIKIGVEQTYHCECGTVLKLRTNLETLTSPITDERVEIARYFLYCPEPACKFHLGLIDLPRVQTTFRALER